MKTSDDIKMTIVYFVGAALKKEIPWSVLHNFLDEMTLNLEKSKKVIKILLEIIQDDQESNMNKVTNDLSHDQPNSVEVETIDKINSEEDGFDIIEEKNTSEGSMKKTILDNEDDISNLTEDSKSESFSSELYSEDENVFDENDVSRNIQLLEAFKGQFYTFVGDNHDEQCEENSSKESTGLDKESENMLNEKTFECETCRKCFNHKSNLKRHMRIHTSEKPFKCNNCNKLFSNLGVLSTHERIHTGEKPFQCQTCQKAFADQSSLIKHKRIHTGEKRFHCKSCKKAFTDSSNLVKHERVHTGEKPFSCKTCKKVFVQSVDLKRHEMTHTGEKLYQCETCKKAFARSFALKEHERIHTGEKPYQCKMCNKTFSHKRNYNRHENKYHKLES